MHGGTGCLILRREVKTKEKIATFNTIITLVLVMYMCIYVYVTGSDRNRVLLTLNGNCQQRPQVTGDVMISRSGSLLTPNILVQYTVSSSALLARPCQYDQEKTVGDKLL
jgi:hypothetical protein